MENSPWALGFNTAGWRAASAGRADDAYKALAKYLVNPTTRKRKPIDLCPRAEQAREEAPNTTRRILIDVSAQAWYALYCVNSALNGNGNCRPADDDGEVMRLFHELDPALKRDVAQRLTRLTPHKTITDELVRWLNYGTWVMPEEMKLLRPSRSHKKRKRQSSGSPAGSRAKFPTEEPAEDAPETPEADVSTPDAPQEPQTTRPPQIQYVPPNQIVLGASLKGLKEVFSEDIVDAVAELNGTGTKCLVAMGQLGPAPPDRVISLTIQPDKVAELALALFRTRVISWGDERYLVPEGGPVPVTTDEIYLRRGHCESIPKVLGEEIARGVNQSFLGKMDIMQTGTRSVTMSFEKDTRAPGFLNLCLGGCEGIILKLYPALAVV